MTWPRSDDLSHPPNGMDTEEEIPWDLLYHLCFSHADTNNEIMKNYIALKWPLLIASKSRLPYSNFNSNTLHAHRKKCTANNITSQAGFQIRLISLSPILNPASFADILMMPIPIINRWDYPDIVLSYIPERHILNKAMLFFIIIIVILTTIITVPMHDYLPISDARFYVFFLVIILMTKDCYHWWLKIIIIIIEL